MGHWKKNLMKSFETKLKGVLWKKKGQSKECLRVIKMDISSAIRQNMINIKKKNDNEKMIGCTGAIIAAVLHNFNHHHRCSEQVCKCAVSLLKNVLNYGRIQYNIICTTMYYKSCTNHV